MREIDFYYDFGSPNVYLAWRALSRVADLRLNLKPVLIGGLFKAANNRPPWQAFADVPAKMEYMMQEIERFAAMYDLPEYHFNPHFPVMTILPMRAAMVALDEGTHERFYAPVQRAMWEQGVDISKPDRLADVLDQAGLDGAAMMARTQETAIKDALKAATQAASSRGIFGLPSWFADNPEGQAELYFGKDCCWMFGAGPVHLP